MSSSTLQCYSGKRALKRLSCAEMAENSDQRKEADKITRKRQRNTKVSSNSFGKSYIVGLGSQSDRVGKLEDTIVQGLDMKNEKELISYLQQFPPS